MFPIIKQKVNCAPVQGTGGDRSGSIRKADALLGQASLGPAVSSTQWGDERKAGLSCAISNLTENCMADTKGRGWQILQKKEQLCSFQRAPQARQTSALKEPCFFRAAANACWHVKYRLYLSQVQPTAQLSCSPAGVKEEDQSLLQPKQSAQSGGGGTLPLSLLPVSQNWRADTDKSLFRVNQDKHDAPLCPQMSQIKHKASKLRLYIILGYFHLSPRLS